MLHPPPHAVQVVVNGHGAANGTNSPRLPRPLSVDEALQYSPLTNSTTFGLDCISFPDVGNPDSSSIISSLEARQEARTYLDALDNDVCTRNDPSGSLRTTTNHLKRLLDGDNLTEFKFKLSPTLNPSNLNTTPIPSNHGLLSRHQLSPFAKMVLDSTDVAYRYSTPHSTPSPKSAKRPSVSKSPSQTRSLINNLSAHNQQAFAQNRAVSIAPGQISENPSDYPIIVLPGLPSSSQHGDYHPLIDRDSSKRRKLNADGKTDKVLLLQARDQKEKANAALQSLQELLQDILEFEDQLQHNAAVTPARDANVVFVAFEEDVEDAGETVWMLSHDMHTQLQKCLRKVAGYGRLDDIPIGYLNRIQKLCERAMVSTQSLDLKVDGCASEGQIEHWLKMVERADGGLMSAESLLWTMSIGRNQKELCREAMIQRIPNVLNNIFDSCIIPAIEARLAGRDSELFTAILPYKKAIESLMSHARSVLSSLSSLFSRVDVAEDVITSTEFLATKLIFAESAHNENYSALDVKVFGQVRRAAMDVLARIFAKYPEQRSFILDEILVSLEKLPSTKQSARQFKLIDGKSIQLLSALVMQLVQTAALQTSSTSSSKKRRLPSANGSIDADSIDPIVDADDVDDHHQNKWNARHPIDKLSDRAEPLHDNAVRNAQYIVKFLVQRAMTSTKTGDQPYRNILDLFTEDLITVLGSTDWPAAELLLRVLASHMIGIADQDKSPANAKNMAIELIGWMGMAISDLTASAQRLASTVGESGSEITGYLRRMLDDHSRCSLNTEEILASDGPYRMTLDHLQERNVNDWQLSSAHGYYLAQWAKAVCSCYRGSDEDDIPREDETVDALAALLLTILFDPSCVEAESGFESVSTNQARLAYQITILNLGFCKAFDTFVKVLLSSIISDQAKVRSRSLKSVIQMLEKDPNLLDRDPTVMRVILRCASDSSPMVRDSALSLIGKCMALKPGLADEGCRTILACMADPTVGVKKRCITLLKDIYLRDSRIELKAAIAESLLQRGEDPEETVAALARQVFEEIWFSPFHLATDPNNETAKTKVALLGHVKLMLTCVQRNESVLPALESFLKGILADESKAQTSNYKVCRAIVSIMFEQVVDSHGVSEKPEQQALLQALMTFAKAKATLFTPEQLHSLQPYIGHLVTADDLFLFKSVVIIYRCVLPHLSTTHKELLRGVQNDLFKSVSKLARAELNEVMACLWTINNVLQNPERLVKLTVSVLKGIYQVKDMDFMDLAHNDSLTRLRSYVRIAGCMGRHCDLENQQDQFEQAFPWWEGGSVAGLLVDFVSPFTLATRPLTLRVMALESLVSVCQSWPGQYNRESVRRALSSVLQEGNADLQNIVIKSFADFYAMHEGAAEKVSNLGNQGRVQNDAGRFGGSLQASDFDGAAAFIAQQFLRDIVRFSVSRLDSFALTATEVIASITRQGIIHPKECAGALVALETSTNAAIVKVAFESHKRLHQAHEVMFEREYMRAIHDAFVYQRDVVGNPAGATTRPFVSKLCSLFDIVKISNSKYQKKFLSHLCGQVNFELKKLDVSEDVPDHLIYARFLIENLAFLEYGQMTELLHTISCVERIVANTGSIVAHAIETEIFHERIDFVDGEEASIPNATSVASEEIEMQNLKMLTTASMILSMFWEARSHLRRQYGISSESRQRDSKGNTSKDLNKAPVKVHGVTGDRFWEAISEIMDSLVNAEAMMRRCQEFGRLLSIDDEVKVAAENNDRESFESGSMDLEEGPAIPGSGKGSRVGKRKSSVSVSGTPKKPRGRGRPSLGRKKSGANLDEDGDWD